jgi:hypothetical protein
LLLELELAEPEAPELELSPPDWPVVEPTAWPLLFSTGGLIEVLSAFEATWRFLDFFSLAVVALVVGEDELVSFMAVVEDDVSVPAV